MREWAKRLALIILSPFLFLALLESGLRLAGYGYPSSFFLPAGGYMTTNRQFGWRFFPKRIARTPLPLRFAVPKPPGVRRVFVLGESAAMGFPDPMFSFAHQMQAIAGGRLEVINTAMTAINSHVILEIAEECARLEPDLVVLYMGNNEVVGPFGPGTVFSASKIAAALKRFSLGQLLSPARRDLTEWRGMEMFLRRQISAGDPLLEQVYRNFGNNLTAIIRVARGAGARVILCTVAVNLRDCPPFAGAAAEEKFRAGDFAAARDLDLLRFRADSRINAIIRDAAARTGASLVDVEKLIPPDSTSFYEHVHLRPRASLRLAEAILNLDGEGFVPSAWDEHRMERDMHALMERPPFRNQGGFRMQRGRIDLNEAEQQYSRWLEKYPEDLLLRERFAELLAERRKHERAVAEWRELLRRLSSVPNWHTGLGESLLAAGRLPEARAAYELAWKIDPQFLAAHIGLGVIAFAEGRLPAAEKHFQDALQLDPQSPEANNNLGRLLDAQGRTQAALEAFRKAVAAKPEFAEAHNNLGVALSRQGMQQEALEAYREAVRIQPGFAGAHYNLGGTYARLGRIGEAEGHYRAAILAQPGFASAHYDLGLLLAGQGKTEEAIAEYRETLRLDPANADAHNNWGSALARAGRIAEAVSHFQEALRLRPGHPQARRNLESARAGRR